MSLFRFCFTKSREKISPKTIGTALLTAWSAFTSLNAMSKIIVIIYLIAKKKFHSVALSSCKKT